MPKLDQQQLLERIADAERLLAQYGRLNLQACSLHEARYVVQARKQLQQAICRSKRLLGRIQTASLN